jgi:senataxin
MSRNGSNQSYGKGIVRQEDKEEIKQEIKQVKQEIKQEIKNEHSLFHHAKRKLSDSPDVKAEADGNNDFDMFDAPSDTASHTLNEGSGRSTPAGFSDAQGRSSPAVDSDRAPTPGDVLGNMRAKPKIKRRPKPSGPFIDNRPKKPRTG